MYDPAREYVERFYNPERGDIMLNPLDARSPPVVEVISFWQAGVHARDPDLAPPPRANPNRRKVVTSPNVRRNR